MVRCLHPVCAALLGVSLALAGCDGGAAQRASLYEPFVGDWTAVRLRVDGVDYTAQLDNRYAALQLTFRSASDDAAGTYTLTGLGSEGDTRLRADGSVELLDERTIVWVGGFERDVFWTYEFATSSRATLRSPGDRAAGSAAFLRRVFPSQSWGGTPAVELHLERRPAQANDSSNEKDKPLP